MNLLKTAKTQLAETKIAFWLGYCDGREPLNDHYHGMYNKDQSKFIIRAGSKFYEISPGLFPLKILSLRYAQKGVYLVRKIDVILPE